jgi:hypothetical protein
MEDAAVVHDEDLVADFAGEAKVLLDHPPVGGLKRF